MNHDLWNAHRPAPSAVTDDQSREFLRALKQGSHVVTAAQKAGRQTQRFYELRHRDPFFAREWDKVLDGRRGCGYKYRTDAERQTSRRESWRRYQQARRDAIKKFPTQENYELAQRVSDPMMRWWLERFPLPDLAAMGSSMSGDLFASSEAA